MNKDDIKTSPAKDIKISLTKRKARKEKKMRLIAFSVIASAVSVIILVMVLTLLLKVKTVSVEGNVLYSEEELISASGIEKGANIITLSSRETERIIKEKFPAVDEIKIKKKLPSTVIIKVSEAEEVMFLAVGRKFYSLDEELRVVDAFDSIDEVELKGLKRIFLPEVTRCIIGESIVTADGTIPDTVKQLYKSLVKYDLFYDVTEIDFQDKFDITMNVKGMYKVKLGNILECDTKLEILCGMLEEMDPHDIGTIDFSDGEIGKAVFSRS